MPSTLLCAPKIPQSETQLPAYLPPTRLSLTPQALGRGRAPANRLIGATKCYKDDISFAWGKTIPLAKHILSSFTGNRKQKYTTTLEWLQPVFFCGADSHDEGKHRNVCNWTPSISCVCHKDVCVPVEEGQNNQGKWRAFENSRFIMTQFYWYLVGSRVA